MRHVRVAAHYYYCLCFCCLFELEQRWLSYPPLAPSTHTFLNAKTAKGRRPERGGRTQVGGTFKTGPVPRPGPRVAMTRLGICARGASLQGHCGRGFTEARESRVQQQLTSSGRAPSTSVQQQGSKEGDKGRKAKRAHGAGAGWRQQQNKNRQRKDSWCNHLAVRSAAAASRHCSCFLQACFQALELGDDIRELRKVIRKARGGRSVLTRGAANHVHQTPCSH